MQVHVPGGGAIAGRPLPQMLLEGGDAGLQDAAFAVTALSDEEIARIPKGPDAPGWSEFDSDLLRATDELLDDSFISDATWKKLEAHYETRQLMDLVFAVGQYKLVSMALNSFGVQLYPGIEGLPSR